MSDRVAQAIYAAGFAVGVGGLIWMVWMIRKTGWSPWHDDEA